MVDGKHKKITRVAFICTGRVNPSISATMGFFITRYRDIAPDVELIAYRNGFRGLLNHDVLRIGEHEVQVAPLLLEKGGSPIGGSRVRLGNLAHLKQENLIKEGENPVETCAKILLDDKVDVLHVIGSTSAQLQAKSISALMRQKYNFELTVTGVPKTIENDIGPIRQTLGAFTAAQAGAEFFNNVVAEHNANPRMLIIHEIKGRAAGWLTAATALAYRRVVENGAFAPALGLAKENYDVHAIYTPEMDIDFNSEIQRLKRCMDRHDNVNIFVAQGAFTEQIQAEATKAGKPLPRHERLKYVLTEPAAWLASKIKSGIKAEKVLIQKSGIYVRASSACRQDLVLAQSLVNHAVTSAFKRQSGVVGHDEKRNGRLRCIEYHRLVSGRKFDLSTNWFVELLAEIGQPQAVTSAPRPLLAKL